VHALKIKHDLYARRRTPVPAALTYPGVYVEEIPSGVRAITGVATSITAFVGYTRKGEPDKAVPISSFAEFERLYGGLDRNSPVSYAVNQFYANGGTQALIVRVAASTQTANWELHDATPVPVLDISASSPGAFGNNIRLSVDSANSSNPDGNFNLMVLQIPDAQVVETHRNLNLNSNSSGFAASVVNNASSLIRVTRKSGLNFTQKGFALSKRITFPLATPSDLIIAGVIDGTKPSRSI
jgi:phage tail sheath protein FI